MLYEEVKTPRLSEHSLGMPLTDFLTVAWPIKATRKEQFNNAGHIAIRIV